MKLLKSITVNPQFFGAGLLPLATCVSVTEKILLSIDDGPDPVATPVILKALETYGIKALFFCSGAQLEKYPALGNEIVAAGHLIGSHLYSHTRVNKLSRKQLADEIKRTNDLVSSYTGSPNKLIRTPYGSLSPALFSELKSDSSRLILWSLLTYDWEKDPDLFKFVVTHFLKKNSIVVMHNQAGLLEYLPDFFEFLITGAEKSGYLFGTPEICLNL